MPKTLSSRSLSTNKSAIQTTSLGFLNSGFTGKTTTSGSRSSTAFVIIATSISETQQDLSLRLLLTDAIEPFAALSISFTEELQRAQLERAKLKPPKILPSRWRDNVLCSTVLMPLTIFSQENSSKVTLLADAGFASTSSTELDSRYCQSSPNRSRPFSKRSRRSKRGSFSKELNSRSSTPVTCSSL